MERQKKVEDFQVQKNSLDHEVEFIETLAMRQIIISTRRSVKDLKV